MHIRKPSRASLRKSFSCSDRPDICQLMPYCSSSPGRIASSSWVMISVARAGSSSDRSPLTETSRRPFSRRTVEKPSCRSTVTMSERGTYSPAEVRIRVRSRKSAVSSPSGSSTRIDAVRGPSG